MASNPYVKSLIWLASFGGLGFVLLKLTEPSEEKLKNIKESGHATHLNEEQKKKLLFMKRLKQATTEEPIYYKDRK